MDDRITLRIDKTTREKLQYLAELENRKLGSFIRLELQKIAKQKK